MFFVIFEKEEAITTKAGSDGFKIQILNELKLKLRNGKFINKSRLLLGSFSRKRHLPFEAIVLFILQKTNHSAQVCLDEFFSHTKKTAPSKSSFTQARKNLCYKVFKRLNLLITGIFYTQASYKKWNSFRVLSVDGSTLRLPTHSSLKEKFSKHGFGAKANVEHWMSRISYLYDVFNGVVIDAQMESFDTSEAALCRKHLPFIKKGDLLLLDRYYASYELMALMLSKGTEFIFRMRSHSWTCVDEFMKSKREEQLVELTLPVKCAYLLTTHHLEKIIQIRLVKKINKKGEVQVFATSLLNFNLYSATSITDLYKQRWNIEEAYKLIKARLQVSNFSGVTDQAVQQDFYAKTLLLSLAAILRFDITINPRKSSRPLKHPDRRIPILNKTYTIDRTKKILKSLWLAVTESLPHLIIEFINKVKSKIEYSRKGQNSPRKKDKGYKTSMGYKPI